MRAGSLFLAFTSNAAHPSNPSCTRKLVTPIAIPYGDYPKDDIFKVAGAGFGGAMMTVDLIKRVGDKFGLPFSPIMGFGEDLSFCVRCSELGVELFCDSRVKMGHVGLGTITEETYFSTR